MVECALETCRCEIVISCAVFEILLIWMAHLKNYTELYQIGIKLDKLPVLFRCARTKIQCVSKLRLQIPYPIFVFVAFLALLNSFTIEYFLVRCHLGANLKFRQLIYLEATQKGSEN